VRPVTRSLGARAHLAAVLYRGLDARTVVLVSQFESIKAQEEVRQLPAFKENLANHQVGGRDFNLPETGHQRKQPSSDQLLHVRNADAELHQDVVRRAGDAAPHALAWSGQRTDLVHALAKLPRRRQFLPHVARDAAHASRARVTTIPTNVGLRCERARAAWPRAVAWSAGSMR
jgi:hypothetical protein